LVGDVSEIVKKGGDQNGKAKGIGLAGSDTPHNWWLELGIGGSP